MRILILSNHDMGLYKFRRELLGELSKEHRVYICVPQGEFTEKLSSLGCRVISCEVLDRRSTNPIKDLNLIKYYKKIINEIYPDIVLTYTIKPNIYGGWVCGKKNIPYIANVTGLGTSIENGGLLAFISTKLYKIGMKKAACVFFQNKNNQNLFLNKKIVRGSSRLIPGSGVNLNSHSFESYPENNENIRFLFVGRVMKDKGIEELLKAVEILHKEYSQVVLDVVGFCDEEKYETQLKAAEKKGTVVFHGTQNDVHPFYKRCNCAVLPSYHEGMANVMLEASATGRPVITTRVPGCQETFDEGITGFGCEAKNTGSLLEAMRKFVGLSHEERIKMGKNARIKIEKEFDRQLVIDAYKEEIYAHMSSPPIS